MSRNNEDREEETKMMVPRHTGVKPVIGGIRNEEYRKNLEGVMMPSR